MDHAKPTKPPAVVIGLPIVVLLLLCGGGAVGIAGFVTYKRIEAVERHRAAEAQLRAVEVRQRAAAAQAAAENARLQKSNSITP